jgi:PAS domain S-box-containing protein
MAMRYPVQTPSMGRTRTGGVHHDGWPGADVLVCLYARPLAAQRRCAVDVTPETSLDELARLRGCLNDLASIMALPAVWTGGEPPQEVSAMLNDLPGMLEQVAQRTNALAAANRNLQNEAAERKRAEEAQRASEREWRLIVDSIPGLVALMSASGDLEVVNQQILAYFGQTLNELKRWGMTDVVHPDDLPHVIELFTKSIVSGDPYDILQRFRRSDGVYRWFRNSGFPLRDTTGQIVRWCVLLTDIDDQKRAEDAIRASELNLKLTIDTIPARWKRRVLQPALPRLHRPDRGPGR